MKLLVTIILLFLSYFVCAQKTNVYFFPGQGADERLFDNIQMDTQLYQLHYFNYPTPKRRERLADFALTFIDSINTADPFVLIGTSLGGMICTELNDTLHPTKTIVISSAKCRKELPHRYRFQRIIPLYLIFPKRALHRGAKVMQPIVEPDRNQHKEVFKSMLDKKDPLYMKRSVGMIIRWKRKYYDENIVHIHGDNDHTIPYRNVKANHTVKNGSHMMTLTQGKDISQLIIEILRDDN